MPQIKPVTSVTKPKVKYTVTVKTGNVQGGSTKAKVFIKIFGTSRKAIEPANTSPIHLTGAVPEDKFLRSSTNTFNVEHDEDLTDLNKIEIMRDDTGDNWYLEDVSITTQDEKIYDFPAKAWVNTPNQYFEFKINTQELKKPVTTSKAKYKVTVKTGDVKHGSTKAKVFIKIFGTSKKTRQPAKTSPIHLTGAVPEDKFLRSSTNTFNVEDDEELIDLSKIEIMRDDKGNDWYLEDVFITTPDEKLFDFPAKAWINTANQYFEFKVTPPKPPTPAPKPPAPPAPQPPASVNPNKPGVTYHIIVFTGSVLKKGTKAQAYMTFFGALATSSEIHLEGPLETGSQTSESKIFKVQREDVGQLLRIRIRQDVSGSSPNWQIQKVLIIYQLEIVYEVLVSSWLDAKSPLEKVVTDTYPATSLKFTAYPQCIHPDQSKTHPAPPSNVMLLDPCGDLPNFFRMHRDGVIQHVASGMCLQGTQKGDPVNTADGDKLTLNNQCTLYRPNYNTGYALQFKFTSGGSLMEVKSAKCISSSQGQANIALTFSSHCDNVDTIIGFIDKRNKVVLPKKVGRSPTKTGSTPGPPSTPTGKSPTRVPRPSTSPSKPSTPATPSAPASPSAPATPSTPGTPSSSPVTASPVTMPGNYGSPVYCPSNCSPGSCTSNCQPLCCSNLQQPGTMPAGYPPVVQCPNYCSPAQCRSECPVGCCFPNLVSWGNNEQQYDENYDTNSNNGQKR